MKDVTTIKTKYPNEATSTSTIDANQWAILVQQYWDARESIVNKTYVYVAIREAFMLGSKINLCNGSANTDQSLLDIYNTDDLSNFFGETKNDSSKLLSQTVTQMYLIYKASLTTIYLKSVVHSDSDLDVRIMIWEQVNLVRANFEYMSQNIVLFIKKTQTDAVSSFSVDSEEYKNIIIALYVCVKKMLLTIVKSTEMHYKRALNFNPDRSMVKTDFNRYKEDILVTYNKDIMWSNTNAALYDMRIIEKEDCSYPSPKMIIPRNLYSSLINRLIFQTLICQVNYVYMRIKKIKYDETNVDSWINNKITMVEFQNSIIFLKYSVTINNIFIENYASYTYNLLITDKSTQSNEVQYIMDQSLKDVVGVLCVNILEITDTYKTIDVFITKNCNCKNTEPIVYKPGTPKPSLTGQTLQTPPAGKKPQTPPAGLTTQTPPAGLTTQTPPAGLTTQTPPAGLTTQTPPAGLTTQTPPAGLTTQTPPAGLTTQTPPAGQKPQTPPAGLTPQTPQIESPPNTYSDNENNFDFQFSYIKSGPQILKTVELLNVSINNKITSSLTYVKNATETEYTKIIIQTLNICQQILQYNTDYLYNVALDSIAYICKKTTHNSREYFNALVVLFKDTQEKINIFSTSMDVPFQRSTIYSLTTTEYEHVVQIIEYSEFVKQLYLYFEVSYDEIYNSKNDADLFLTNSIAQFNIIYEKVVMAVKQTPDDPYKIFLLSYLEKTKTAHKLTTDCFKEQIVLTQEFISNRGDNSKYAFYQEIVQRLDSINVMYSGVLIKCFEYSKNTAGISIFKAEFDIVVSQTAIVSSYTSYTKERTIEVEIEFKQLI